MLEQETAARYARVGLANVAREYPNHPGHLLTGPADLREPRELHPLFYGSYDWHSAVHQHWMLARLLRLLPGLAEAEEITAWFTERWTVDAVAAEVAYFLPAERRSFERAYGWAWLLTLHAELAGWPGGEPFAVRLGPLAALLRERALGWLRRSSYPVRSGLHPNSAFAATLLVDVAAATGDRELDAAVREAAHRWYAADRGYPAFCEPSATDFLSPALTEADLMTRVLDATAFPRWFAEFLPDPGGLVSPPVVDDPTDPQVVHLAGLTLSRAWAWEHIAARLPEEDSAAKAARAAAGTHRAAGLSGAIGGDYVGEHWLPSFALYLTAGALTPTAAPAAR